MDANDKLFAALWWPLAIAVFYYTPPSEPWARHLGAFLMGAVAYYHVLKWAKGGSLD